MISENVNKYCCEDISLIENYNKAINDTKQMWDCHHRKEIDEGLSLKQLKELGLYFYRPAIELIFLTHKEHAKLHGLNIREETRKKQSELNKGRIPWNKGLTTPEETCKKISESMKGFIPWSKGKHHSEETKKKQSDANKGKPSPIEGKHRVYDENGKYHYEF